MAHYSKKRPIFKPSTDRYKKSRWQKIKEDISQFFNNIRRSFAKFAGRVHDKGKQQFSIMIVPYNEKGIINIRISKYVMVTTLILLGVIITTSIVAISGNQSITKANSTLKDQNQSKSDMIREYVRGIDSLNNRFTHFKDDISETVRSAGTSKGSKGIYDYHDIELSETSSNSYISKHAKQLKKLEFELDITKKSVNSLGEFIAKYKTLLKRMPSVYPLRARARITSPYGPRIDPVYRWRREFHSGLDMATLPGTPILAGADGVVVAAGWHGGYGWLVKIKHKYGFKTKYAHMQKLGPNIQIGTKVIQGQTIGYVGTSGKSTGYHLHYEVIIGDKTVNPLPFINMLP